MKKEIEFLGEYHSMERKLARARLVNACLAGSPFIVVLVLIMVAMWRMQ